jgi:hypothetical protein
MHFRRCSLRRVIHNAAAPATTGPLRSIMDNVGDGIRRRFTAEILPRGTA